MSVQAGIFHFDGAPADSGWLAKTSSLLCEYGPDGEYTHIDGSLGIMYRPFHTTAESQSQHQPIVLADGTLVVWDGRLDNRDELITSLRLAVTTDTSDARIMACAFERCGTESFRKLLGDWAASIWDPHERRIILARDYIGVKQLFYYLKRDTLMWCNHLAALAQCGDRFQISDEYIAGYLAFKPDAHLTPYEGIRSVRPGSFVIANTSHLKEQRFWSFDPRRQTRYLREIEYQEQYLHLLRQSVKRRLRSQGPVLSSLSGGLDSSSMVCVADDLLAKGETQVRVDTISYYDHSEPGEDDSYYLALVERKRGRGGFHIELKRPEECLPFEYERFRTLPGFAMRSELTSSVSTIIRRDGYRVLLSGTGGDEMNAQALSIPVAMADLVARLRLLRAGEELFAWSYLTRTPLLHLFCATLLEFLPLRIRARFVSRGKLQPWINRQFAKRHSLRARQLEHVPGIWFWRPGPRDAAQTIMTLSNQLAFSSPSTIEERYPYLDQELVEFLTSIPFEQLLRPGKRRLLMRNALSGLVPEEILRRKTKVSAMRCYSLALRRHWNQVSQVLDAPLTSLLRYCDADMLRADLLNVRNGQCPLHLVRLLKALSLELWLRDGVSRGIIAVPHGLSAPSDKAPSTPELIRKDLVATKN